MLLQDALNVLAAWRTDQVVISSMGSARESFKQPHPLDLHYVPSAMGQVTTLGLGLALARPERHIVTIIGDGSLLMNLGCLTTIAAAGAPNLTVLLLDNGVYEVTGGQRTAGQVAGVDYLALAAASGLPALANFEHAQDWKMGIEPAMSLPGPRFIRLIVAPVTENYYLPTPLPMPPRIAQLRAALGVI